MFWSLLIFAALVSASPTDSIFSCGQSVTALLAREDQTGPLYFDRQLLITSINTQGVPLLLVHGGAGLHSVPLSKVGVNRLRFTLPTAAGEKEVFISYLHDSWARSRIFDIELGRPALGKPESEYRPTRSSVAANLKSHFEYKIFETAEGVATGLDTGKLARAQIRPGPAVACTQLRTATPSLGAVLKRHLDSIEMMVQGPRNQRMPASVAAHPRSAN